MKKEKDAFFKKQYEERCTRILFYQDAEVSAEYTPGGYFDYTDEFLQAVQNDPVLEGWGNKVAQISIADFTNDGK